MKLTEIIKHSAIGAFVPGSIAHNCAKGSTDQSIAAGIKDGRRKSAHKTIGDKFDYGVTAVFVGMYDVILYGFCYGTALSAAIGTNLLGMSETTFNQPSPGLAAIIGLITVASRAGLNLFYKGFANEEKEAVQEALVERYAVNQT